MAEQLSAYKKLTKKSDFCRNQNDLNVTDYQSADEKKRQSPDVSKSLRSEPLCTKKDPMSSTDNDAVENGPGRIRTSDQWIMSPLL
jgi:hypothetical protein